MVISAKEDKHLRFILVECANALSRSKNNHLKVFYERLKKSKGHRQAVVATARKLLVIIYHLLTNEEIYEDDLMLKPKKVKMPSHKKKYSPADKITFDDKISEKIQDVIDKTIRTLNPMKITQ